MLTTTGGNYPWKEPATPIARGAFIVIEGLDRAGKTTQVKQLCDALYEAGHNVKMLRFPGMRPTLLRAAQILLRAYRNPY
jgi:dTMP kinase